MSRRKSFIKAISVILSLLILLTALPLGVLAADTAEVTTDVKVEDVTSENMSFAGARVRAEEGDGLNTIVINNGDGTHTMTLYDHPVKYVDEKGEVQDISLEIASATDGSYKTKANDIQTVFPKKISDGISLSGKGVSVKLTPSVQPPLVREVAAQPSEGVRNDEGVVPYDSLPLEGKVSPQVTDEVSTVTRLDNETVSYYYDSKTTLEYSLTYTGFKEDIVVSEYTGQTEYHFLLETGGLTLTKIDESYYLSDENGEVKATLGDIIIFTADERNNALGSMTHVTVRENQQYIITIHVDAEYLKDEKTKYPIRIDPTIEITHDNNGSGAIQDVTLNENSGSSGSSGSIYVGKRNTYGISRTLMKFPGLNLNTIPSANNVISAYVEIRDMLCETTSMMVYGCVYAGDNWSESTANWSNTQPNAYTEMPHAYAEVSYSNGNAKNPKHRYSLNITQAVKYWKSSATNSLYTKDKGIILKASDEVEYSNALYKTFASYNRASNKPSLKVSYYAGNVVLLGIPDADTQNHDHSTVFTTITPYLQTKGLTCNIYHENTLKTTVEGYLDNNQNSVFVSRGHGGCLLNGNGSVAKTYIYINKTTLESLSNQELFELELSNLKLAVFCGCETGKGGEGANNLPTVAVQKGAGTAIGFQGKIQCSDANQWTERFFYYLSVGHTVQSACNMIKNSTVLQWKSKTTIDTFVICGNKQAVF